MKTKNAVLWTLTVVAAVACVWGPPAHGDAQEDLNADAPQIKWYSYDEGTAIYQNEGKRIYINFYADWCAYCKVMDKNTFTDPSVVRYLNKRFIPIKVNSEKDTETAKLFRVRGLPDNWFIETDGKVIGHRPGYIPPDVLLKILESIEENDASD